MYDNLIKHDYMLVGWCCRCTCNGETVDHLLLHYTVVFDLLSFAFRSFGILGSNG